ncbi:Scr1 family TA system antitoxin-like transcriptional regulator [Amycolatopsis sp. NPDC059021]|uniref:helix-turn-helix domain-containing protein n=1 Tax=Amycolatopsis sp. NPDC059021 TaxID=3346704 RepID=UPI00366E6777
MGQRRSTPVALTLGLGLRAAREERRIGVRALAAELGIEPATVSTMELATRTPSVEYVTRVLGFLAVKGPEYRRLVTLAQHTQLPNWIDPGPVEYPALLLEYERTASTLLAWAPRVVPDLVQTPDYARTVLDSGILTGDEIDQGLMMRLVRHDAAFAGDTPATVIVLLGERVLRHRVGGAGVLREQLRYLLALIDADSVAVRIVPAEPGGRPGPLSPFSLFRFPARDPVVGLCQDHLYAYLTEQAQVDRYTAVARQLLNRALEEQTSRARIAEAITALGRASSTGALRPIT